MSPGSNEPVLYSVLLIYFGWQMVPKSVIPAKAGNSFSVITVKSTDKELDPRLRGGDEIMFSAFRNFNYLHAYLSAYEVKPLVSVTLLILSFQL